MTHRLLLRSFPSFVVVCLFGLLLGVMAGPDALAQTDSVARVRAVHIVSGAPSVDAYLDDISPALINGVAFLDASRSIRLKPGTHNMKIAATGTPKEAAVINQDIMLNNDTAYTVFATGSLTALDVQPVVLTRSLSTFPTPGRTLARVLHAGFGMGPLDIVIKDAIGTENTMNNISYRSSSDYVALSAGEMDVEVRTPGGDPIYKATGIIPQGSLITIIAVGNPMDENFRLSVLLDSDSLAAHPMDTLRRVVDNPNGRLRLVHAASRIGRVEVAVGDGPMPGLSFRDAGPSDELEGRAYKLSVHGPGPGPLLYEEEVEVIPNLYRAAVLVGNPDDESVDLVVLTADAGATPEAGMSSIRFLNASDDIGIVNVEIEYSNLSTRQIMSSGFKNFSPYDAAKPGHATIRVTRNGESEPVFVAEGIIPADIIGTLILSGQLSTGNLGLNLLIDSDNDAQAPMLLFNGTTGVKTTREIVSHMDAVPNPVLSDLTLTFGIVRPERLTLEVFDVNGERRASKPVGLYEAGEHTVHLDLGGCESGTYVVVLQGEDGTPFGIRQVVKVR